MAKNDNAFFDRLRQAGLRKQVAKTLSGISGDANKKAVRAAQNAISELRGLADELERRLPAAKPATRRIVAATASLSPGRRSRGSGTRGSSGATASRSLSRASSTSRGSRSTGSSPRASGTSGRASGASGQASGTGARTSGTGARASTRSRGTRSGGSTARAPRGANKAKILASLKAGPKTASEVAKQTGIGTGTVGTTLTKLASSGEVVKAERGYRLPG
jgi:hypothetical protein